MITPKVSLLLLTHNRYFMTKYCLENLINKAGDIDFELLIFDNGSEDKRLLNIAPERILPKNAPAEPDYFQYVQSETNVGIAAGYNALLRKAKGEYICFLSNDILVGDNWLFDLINYNNEIDKSGLTSIHCEGDKGILCPMLNVSDGMTNIWKTRNNVTSGISLINRSALDAVGAFDESVGLFGKEREQYAMRLSLLGYKNFYIPNQYSVHLGRGMNDVSEYRKWKDVELQKSSVRLPITINEMKQNKSFKIELCAETL